MGCCEGSCSCGKGNQSPEQKNIHLVQMSASQEMRATHDWIKGLGSLWVDEEVVEIRFKNSRKAFYRNRTGFSLKKDERIVVEVEAGYDLGTVSLAGSLAEKQFEQKSTRNKAGLKKVYRKATQVDLEKWLGAKKRERAVLLHSRRLAGDLGLEVSISDVEFQGDGGKVTVYYTADGKVDFRQLIGKYTLAFQVKIEMKQVT